MSYATSRATAGYSPSPWTTPQGKHPKNTDPMQPPGTKGSAPAVEPVSIDARAERQHDGRFEVLGPAPEWALHMRDNVPGSED